MPLALVLEVIPSRLQGLLGGDAASSPGRWIAPALHGLDPLLLLNDAALTFVDMPLRLFDGISAMAATPFLPRRKRTVIEAEFAG